MQFGEKIITIEYEGKYFHDEYFSEWQDALRVRSEWSSTVPEICKYTTQKPQQAMLRYGLDTPQIRNRDSVWKEQQIENLKVTTGQMYIQYMKPYKTKDNTNFIMIHGMTLTGKCYETTPDGRMGWYEYWSCRHDFKVEKYYQTVNYLKSRGPSRHHNSLKQGCEVYPIRP